MGQCGGNALQLDLKKRLQITLKEAVRIILGCGLERKVNEVYMMGRATVVENLRKLSVLLLSKINYLRKPVIINVKLLPEFCSILLVVLWWQTL